jgi:carbon storage regulator CsrA
MLVITRREGEEVVIGDPNNPIGVVRIASIKGDRVRIAFDFPRHIDVHRREVAQQILSALVAVAEAEEPVRPSVVPVSEVGATARPHAVTSAAR